MSNNKKITRHPRRRYRNRADRHCDRGRRREPTTAPPSTCALPFVRDIYGNCDPNSLVAVGSVRPKDSQPDRDPYLHYLYPVRVRDLGKTVLSVFNYRPDQVQYWMLNTLTEHALVKLYDEYQVAIADQTPLYFRARNCYVAELNAIYLDLDVGRGHGDKTGVEALNEVADMCERGLLPYPTFGVLSGRGAYALYLLRDEDSANPPGNTPENLHAWKAIGTELRRTTEHLKSDPQASNEARWLKRPDAIDPKTGNRVTYTIFPPDGPLRRYRISDLCNALAIRPEPRTVKVRPSATRRACVVRRNRKSDRPKAPSLLKRTCNTRRTDAAARKKIKRRTRSRKTKSRTRGSEPFARRIDEFERLSRHRGGIQVGMRSRFLLVYYKALLGYYKITVKNPTIARRQAKKRVLGINNMFLRPKRKKEIEQQIFGSRPLRFKNSTVASHLGVTEQEADSLNLRSLVPESVAADRRSAKDERQRRRIERGAAIDNDLLRTTRSQTEIAKEHGVSRQAVNKRLHRLKEQGQTRPVPKRTKPFTTRRR